MSAGVLDEPFDDRQPDARPAGLPRPRLLDAVEPLPDSWEILRRDVGAGVGDADQDAVGFADGLDPIVIENDRLLRFKRTTPEWTKGKPALANIDAAFLGWAQKFTKGKRPT